jgi:hypothetical protein
VAKSVSKFWPIVKIYTYLDIGFRHLQLAELIVGNAVMCSPKIGWMYWHQG